MFKGSLVALITPFLNGGVDENAFQEHVAWQVGQGTHGLVPCGTTGESPTLGDDEHKRVIALCVEVAKGKAPVIAGSGTNSTEHTIELTRQAKAATAAARSRPTSRRASARRCTRRGSAAMSKRCVN